MFWSKLMSCEDRNGLPKQNPKRHAASPSSDPRLIDCIRKAMQQSGGAISFSHYMDLCLYQTPWSYYQAAHPIFGGAGDFVTAPELSDWFTKALAQQCAQVLHTFAKRDVSADMIEFGAGSGKMAATLLLTLAELGGLDHPDVLPKRYMIVEPSDRLQQHQRAYLEQKIPQWMPRIKWYHQLPEQDFCGVMVANEVLDAMPVDCFIKTSKGILERCVAWHAEGLDWQISSSPPRASLRQALDHIPNLEACPDGYRSEVNLRVGPWLHQIAQSLQQGVVLLLDYGYERNTYYHLHRHQGTLACFDRHTLGHNPFLCSGQQDITAHVDFSWVSDRAHQAGLALSGYTHQAAFLMDCGILQRVELGLEEAHALGQAKVSSQWAVSQELKQLLLPTEMGELVKVMALSKAWQHPLIGFQSLDLRERL